MKHALYLKERKRLKAILNDMTDLEEVEALRDHTKVSSPLVAKRLADMFDERIFYLRQAQGRTMRFALRMTPVARGMKKR